MVKSLITKALYKTSVLQRLTGPVLRPGGLGLTRESAMKCGLEPGHRVLDVGCGYGAAVKMLAGEFSLLAWGIDSDLDLLRLNPGKSRIQARAQTLPFRSNSFRALFCECVLSLTPDMGVTLGEFGRVLEPGGALVLCDIHIREKRYCDQLKNIPLICGFRQALDKQEIQELVQGAGFENYRWEDLSHLLTQLAGQAVFDHGSLVKFWADVFGGECPSSLHTCEIIRASRPGYFRIIAKKKKQREKI